MRVITAFVLLAVTASASSVAAAASPPHPRLMANSRQLVALRNKLEQPRFARFKTLLLSDADAGMNYQGLHPQPGKDIGEGSRALGGEPARGERATSSSGRIWRTASSLFVPFFTA